MSEVFFVGDTHFGHREIIQFSETAPHCPFATIEEHDAEQIRRWNSVVSPKEMVWHLGDFCFGKRNQEIAAQLNGNKKLDNRFASPSPVRALQFSLKRWRLLRSYGNWTGGGGLAKRSSSDRVRATRLS
jgi:hypothetical protein